ncbi:hypothetical protein MXB_1705 [Myxobolus squamalis]|nr:hypothetical protein MXB_1705 [Myxobolus squamalis]
MGDRGAPHLLYGGKAHAPKPKNWGYQLPKQIVRYGYRIMLSQKLKEKRPSTKICIADVNIPTAIIDSIDRMKNLEIYNIFSITLIYNK